MLKDFANQMFASESSDTFVEYVLEHIKDKHLTIDSVELDRSFITNAGEAREWVSMNDIPVPNKVHSAKNCYRVGNGGEINDTMTRIPLRRGVSAIVVSGEPVIEEHPALSPYNVVSEGMVDARVESQHDNPLRFTVRAAVDGMIGTAPDGITQVVYTTSSIREHTFGDLKLLNLNHNFRAKIGELVESFVSQGELFVTFELSNRFAFMAPMIRNGDNQGFSIEAMITDYVETDDPFTFEALSFELSGLAVLLAVKPACPNDICHVVSSEDGANSVMEITPDVKEQIDSATKEDLMALNALIHTRLVKD